jgi:hypothetical protein
MVSHIPELLKDACMKCCIDYYLQKNSQEYWYWSCSFRLSSDNWCEIWCNSVILGKWSICIPHLLRSVSSHTLVIFASDVLTCGKQHTQNSALHCLLLWNNPFSKYNIQYQTPYPESLGPKAFSILGFWIFMQRNFNTAKINKKLCVEVCFIYSSQFVFHE